VKLEVRLRDISVDELDAMYTEHPSPAAMAVSEDLSYEDIEALEVEGESLLETGIASRWDGRVLCFKPETYEKMSRRRITALKKTIEHKRPDWVEDIKQAARASNDMYVIIGLSRVRPYPGVAILENLKERGELPQG
jgi:hypothetical protein